MKILMFFSSLCFCFLCFASSPPQYHYYNIEGLSFNDLLTDLNQKGPKGYHAYTKWDLDWRYRYDKTSSQCKLKKIAVNITIVITFPLWKEQSNAPQLLVTEWKRYKNALMKHELGHAKFGKLAQLEIEHALHNLPPESTCDKMRTKANKVAYRILDKFKREDSVYDQNTKHGHTQGAYFSLY